MALLAAPPVAPLMYGGILAFVVGEGIFNASQGALISIAAPVDAQGQVQDGAQALGSLAQMVGPLGGVQLYVRFGPAATFGTGAALVRAAHGLLVRQKHAAPVDARASSSPGNACPSWP
ncbi:hypothetical protein DEIPH_ctg031orf0071 [Deinococcus phoenicis]|uniref:Major facilitator superfamily (MFS) profile domain-containing protein n=1 Tax=Deinococcus phoenicis TaxID=1476583 RepID=A0A016QP52_9DEIO|nr:hypothetical protein [Deinococcus phoenicis]EYB67925.1 hypothetical protein DEIPH_ctg031orf0071 [Deinococcus phoenicis]